MLPSQCKGLTNSPKGEASAADCKQACCDILDCTTWQWTSVKHPRENERCWIGHCKDPPTNNSQWIGAVAQTSNVSFKEFDWTFNDSSWQVIEVPHDFIITLPYSNTTGSRKTGYFPRSNAFYRKHFRLPSSWMGQQIYLRFEGVYKVATVYINGKYVRQYGGSDSAYTQFLVRLDNLTNVQYGASSPANVIAIHIDGSYGTEHWYSGAGLYRSVHLEHFAMVHVAYDSFFVPSTVQSVGATNQAKAAFRPQLTVVNGGAEAATDLAVHFTIFGAEGNNVGQTTVSVAHTIPPGGSLSVSGQVTVANATLWGVQNPYLYTVQAALTHQATALVDNMTVTTGVREFRWDADQGLFLNRERVKLRGFCHHDDFTVVPTPIWHLTNLLYYLNIWHLTNLLYYLNIWHLTNLLYLPYEYGLSSPIGRGYGHAGPRVALPRHAEQRGRQQRLEK